MVEGTTAPATSVKCYISKKQIRIEDAREVAYEKGKNVWVHKRFVEGDSAANEDQAGDTSANDDDTSDE